MRDLEFNGISDPVRPRVLQESVNNLDHQEDLVPPSLEDRDKIIDDQLYKLAETFAKGEALKRAISKMEPAQFIPVDSKAEDVIAGCSRLFKEESEDGSIITFSMYQKCIEKINKKKRDSSYVFKVQNPSISTYSITSATNDTKGSGSGENIIKEFLDHNGIAGSIISMLILSPFQGTLFQSLSPAETTTRTAQSIQIPVGLALLIELGIKAERIYKMLKSSKLDIPLIEDQLERVQDPAYREQVLANFGIDYSQLKKDLEITDCESIISYVSDYYSRYGGLVGPNSHLTIDHWIAYFHVSQNQEIVRGALNIAPNYSDEFYDMSGRKEPEKDNNIINSKEKTKMSIQLASSMRAIREQSNNIYDDIVNSLLYQVSDDVLCCLVSILGDLGNTDMIKTMASVLRILAVDLGGELVRIDNIARGFLANYFGNVIFDIISDIERVIQKYNLKIAKIFTIDIKGTEKCAGLLSLGYALLESTNLLLSKLKGLVNDIMSILNSWGEQKPGAWIISADRRHLLGIARILEVMAAKIDVANTCKQKIKENTTNIIAQEPVDQIDFEYVHKILGESPPTLQMSRKDLDKYFPNLKPAVSEKLKYMAGIQRLQNLEEGTENNCSKTVSLQEIESLSLSIQDAMKRAFD